MLHRITMRAGAMGNGPMAMPIRTNVKNHVIVTVVIAVDAQVLTVVDVRIFGCLVLSNSYYNRNFFFWFVMIRAWQRGP